MHLDTCFCSERRHWGGGDGFRSVADPSAALLHFVSRHRAVEPFSALCESVVCAIMKAECGHFHRARSVFGPVMSYRRKYCPDLGHTDARPTSFGLQRTNRNCSRTCMISGHDQRPLRVQTDTEEQQHPTSLRCSTAKWIGCRQDRSQGSVYLRAPVAMPHLVITAPRK